MDIMFFGPPGAGKGTQGKILEERLGVRPISTGDLLRKHRTEQTEYGKIAQQYLDRGDLVPDDVVIAIVRQEMEQSGGGLLFDGFPRTRKQAEAFTGLLRELHRGHPAVILFKIGDEEIYRRLALRQRADDKLETIKNRLEVYRRETEPMIDYYRGIGPVHEVPADLPVDEVAKRIDESLGAVR